MCKEMKIKCKAIGNYLVVLGIGNSSSTRTYIPEKGYLDLFMASGHKALIDSSRIGNEND